MVYEGKTCTADGDVLRTRWSLRAQDLLLKVTRTLEMKIFYNTFQTVARYKAWTTAAKLKSPKLISFSKLQGRNLSPQKTEVHHRIFETKFRILRYGYITATDCDSCLHFVALISRGKILILVSMHKVWMGGNYLRLSFWSRASFQPRIGPPQGKLGDIHRK